jgi:hypothetical protein
LRTLADLKFLKPSYNQQQLMWPTTALRTFGRNVASFVPAGFEAYARIFNPFRSGNDSIVPRTWRELAKERNVDLDDLSAVAPFALHGIENAQAREGEIDKSLIDPLIEHLTRATTTPSRCFFAAWEGYGGTIARKSNGARLELPARGYYLFEGPIDGATESFDPASFGWQPSNLWWPEDHAWFVANDTDWAWTYVGGSRALIDSMLADKRFDIVEVKATDRW